MFKLCYLPFLVFSGCTAATESTLSDKDFGILTAQIQQKVAGRPAFQGAALLMRGNEVLWQYQQGPFSPQHSQQIVQGPSFDQQSVFFVGSISKTLAAMLVMQQVQSGTVDLQAPVKRYLPELKQPWAASVRVADLLNHSSGLVDINTQNNYGEFRYNNLNFQLLGQILTAVTKRPYAELAAQLLQQCQMHSSGFADKADRVSQGWYEEQGQLKAITAFIPVEAEPSGGLIASAADIAVLPLCMQQQLNKTSLHQMTTSQMLRQHRWGEVYYGYGVQITQTAAGVEWSHGGYIPGFVSVFNYFPQHQLSLVVLENQALNPADLARAAYYHDKLRGSVIQILSQSH
ncbi:penicillin-binding protein, beta-lactamase class C [Rheinheimera sp. A13L]|uniref:serine hydrolase domain-containing protein n=1 Tax=Rheinheimera sp. A13L TaxID=506534 RepID=UPI0002125574|nr:serine hydrolase domain-containing protein [Rheinheimera sp. A13L]EGM77813.1 penicillin-binding protein, beta-lactamase class C [Rheinheimera sp. A13L]